MENRIFRPIMRLIVVVLLCAFWPSIARAFDTIACDEPNGFRYNYENTGEITEERETAKGSYPTFKIDPQDSGKLLVYWADSKLAQRIFPGYNTGEEPSRAIIVKRTPSVLIALQPFPKAVWMYSFFPDRGVGFYSRHKEQTLLNPGLSTSMLHSKCQFSSEQANPQRQRDTNP